jgi:hypothetical protein
MVPPAGRAVVRVKPKVTGTAARDAILSVVDITNVTAETCPTIFPDETATDSIVSAEVFTVTPTAPGVTAPMVKPLKVITTAEAGTDAFAVVMIIEVDVVTLQVAVSPETLVAATVGDTPEAKKSGG